MSNSARPDDEPPDALLLPSEDELEPEVPPADDDDDGEELLPCDIDGELLLGLDELVDEPAA